MPSDSVLVVGVCSPERIVYARQLAEATSRRLVRVGGMPSGHAPGEGEPVVAEVATDADLFHLDLVSQHPLTPIVCVADAQHLTEDLRDGIPLIDTAAPDDERGHVGARARQAARFIEAASMVCLVHWEHVQTRELSILMALVSHLNPGARVRLSRGAAEDARSLTDDGTPGASLAERAGWVAALNDEHDPYMTDRRVSTLRYANLRPFHPGRLSAALDELDTGRHGLLLRSAGFCRLATRSHTLARWEQVGSAMWIDPLTSGMAASHTGQDLALTGIDLRAGALTSILDGATVTDAELAAGPSRWEKFDDPLPRWPEAAAESDRDSH